jgi:RHS repeat-associated protein
LPLEQITGTKPLFYYQDQLGSTRAMLDGKGSTQATYTYGAYGDLKSSTGTVSNPFGYAGQYTDSESGLQYLRARYYDPSTAQFLTVDPMVGATGEPYGYGANTPLNLTDPFGLACQAGPFSVPGPFGSGGNCSDDIGTGLHRKLDSVPVPDYVIVSGGYGLPIPTLVTMNVGGQIVITRDGHIYIGGHAGPGTLGPSGFVGVGYINGGSTTVCDRDNFVGASGVTVHGQVGIPFLGGLGPGGSYVYGTPGQLGKHSTGEEYGAGWGTNVSVIGGYNWRIR